MNSKRVERGATALETTKSNDSLRSSRRASVSARPVSTVTSSKPRSRVRCSRNLVFLPIESRRNRESEFRAIFRGMPGNPAPLPTSSNRNEPSGGSILATVRESTKCFNCISSAPVILVRLAVRLQSRRRSKYRPNRSIWAVVRSRPRARAPCISLCI